MRSIQYFSISEVDGRSKGRRFAYTGCRGVGRIKDACPDLYSYVVRTVVTEVFHVSIYGFLSP